MRTIRFQKINMLFCLMIILLVSIIFLTGCNVPSVPTASRGYYVSVSGGYKLCVYEKTAKIHQINLYDYPITYQGVTYSPISIINDTNTFSLKMTYGAQGISNDIINTMFNVGYEDLTNVICQSVIANAIIFEIIPFVAASNYLIGDIEGWYAKENNVPCFYLQGAKLFKSPNACTNCN